MSKISFFLRFYLFTFRERGREGEREEDKHQCLGASHTPPTGDLACNPSMCPGEEANQPSFSSQSSAQSTEPHHPGQKIYIYIKDIHKWKWLFSSPSFSSSSPPPPSPPPPSPFYCKCVVVKNTLTPLAGVAQWIEHQSAKQKVTGLLPTSAHAWLVE